MQGWIKLHRELTQKAIWLESTPEQKTILITLLMMANHDEKEWEWRGKRYKAKPGQFVTSLPSIVEKCGKGVSTQNVRTALKRFEKYEFLTDQSTNRNRLITIVNWGLYQSAEDEINNQTNRRLTGNQQATNRQLTANKNDKNDKNDKEKTLVKESVKIDYQNIVEQYHSLCPSLPRVIKLTPKRKTAIKARVNEYDKTTLIDVFKKAEASNFLSGRDGKWRGATFDWILKASNFLKIVEGNYDERPTKNNREKISGTVRGVSQDRGSPKWDHLYE